MKNQIGNLYIVLKRKYPNSGTPYVVAKLSEAVDHLRQEETFVFEEVKRFKTLKAASRFSRYKNEFITRDEYLSSLKKGKGKLEKGFNNYGSSRSDNRITLDEIINFEFKEAEWE